MQLSDLRSHCYDLLDQDSATATDGFSTTVLNRWLNRSAKHLVQIIKRHSPEEFTKSGTLNTVVDTREYNLITNFSDFQDLHRVERNALGSTARPTPMVVDFTFDRGRRGVANRLYLRSHLLGFYRAPTSIFTLTVHYGPDVTAMSADANDLDTLAFQTPRVRDAFHDAIIVRTVYTLLLAEGSDQAAALFKQESAEAELDMIRTLSYRRRGPRRMKRIDRRVYRPSAVGN